MLIGTLIDLVTMAWFVIMLIVQTVQHVLYSLPIVVTIMLYISQVGMGQYKNVCWYQYQHSIFGQTDIIKIIWYPLILISKLTDTYQYKYSTLRWYQYSTLGQHWHHQNQPIPILWNIPTYKRRENYVK